MKIKKCMLAGLICLCSMINVLLIRQLSDGFGSEKLPVTGRQMLSISKTNIDEPEQLYARSAVLMDADSGRVLFGKEPDQRLPMASTTKIMTCILALEATDGNPIVQVSEIAARQPKVHLGVQMGEEFYLRDLLYSMMLESHNDSAVLVAEKIAGSVSEFTKQMNEKAAEIGCMETHFVTPNGLDEEDESGAHMTTAADLARIMKYCITESPKRAEFLEITATKTWNFSNVSGTRSFTCINHNLLLDTMDGAISGKTGFTGKAGYCYVGAVRRDERTLIVALLACGWPGNKKYKWIDCCTLFTYGFQNYQYQNVWEPLKPIDIPIPDGVSDDPGKKNRNGQYCLKAGLASINQEVQILKRPDEQIQKELKLKSSVKAPVKQGDVLGVLTYRVGDFECGQCEVVALEAMEKRSFLWYLKGMLWQYLHFQVFYPSA